MSKVLTALGRLFTITRVTANSVTECGSSDPKGAQRRDKRFFCAHVMVSCAWDTFGCAGVLSPGLPHLRTVRHQLRGSNTANSKIRKEFHHV